MAVSDLKDSSPVDIEQEIEKLRRLAPTAPPITTNAERRGGQPVIGLSRVPVASMIDHFAAGYSLDEFLDQFPSADRDKAVAALDMIKEALDEGWLAERIDY